MKTSSTGENAAATADVANEYLTAEDIFASDDIDYVDVVVPEWKTKNGNPGTIRLVAMSADDAIKFTKELKSEKSEDSFVRIVAATAVNVNPDGTSGDKMFNGDVMVHRLRKKKSGIFIRLQKAVMKLNELGDDAKKD